LWGHFAFCCTNLIACRKQVIDSIQEFLVHALPYQIAVTQQAAMSLINHHLVVFMSCSFPDGCGAPTTDRVPLTNDGAPERSVGAGQ
jgi:hypothetical protein